MESKLYSGFVSTVLNHLAKSDTLDKLEAIPVNIYNSLIKEIDNGYEEE